MSGHDWRDLPPEVRRYIEATTRVNLEERQITMRWAPLLCRCCMYYDHEDPGPAQEGCYVHTTVVIGQQDWM